MTEENKAKLMQAYRAAIAAGQDGIADMLKDVILGEMGSADGAKTIVYRDWLPTLPATLPTDNQPLYPKCEITRANKDSQTASDIRHISESRNRAMSKADKARV